jgi:hypothetical protein
MRDSCQLEEDIFYYGLRFTSEFMTCAIPEADSGASFVEEKVKGTTLYYKFITVFVKHLLRPWICRSQS